LVSALCNKEAVHQLRERRLKLFGVIDSLAGCLRERLSGLGPKPLLRGQGEPAVDRQSQV
jgi:hypothetical protein